MKHITEYEFNTMLSSIAKKLGKDPNKLKQKLAEILAEEGTEIGTPLLQQIRVAQVCAAEDVVVANLNRTDMSVDELAQQIHKAKVIAGESAAVKKSRQ